MGHGAEGIEFRGLGLVTKRSNEIHKTFFGFTFLVISYITYALGPYPCAPDSTKTVTLIRLTIAQK